MLPKALPVNGEIRPTVPVVVFAGLDEVVKVAVGVVIIFNAVLSVDDERVATQANHKNYFKNTLNYT